MVVDPTDGCTFWYTQEYYPATSSASWHTRIGSFKFASCGAAPAGADLAIAKTASAGAVRGSSLAYTLTVTNNGPRLRSRARAAYRKWAIDATVARDRPWELSRGAARRAR